MSAGPPPLEIEGELPTLAGAARRPLPDEDDTLAALSPEERSRVARDWAGRAEAELGAASVFAAVSRGLFHEAAAREILWLASRAVCDEIRHSEICRYVALRYGGTEPARTDPPAIETPRFGDATPRTSRLLHAVLQCCINEGIGSAYLGACLDEARGPLARAAVRELLADDVDHARIGWALLASDRLPPGFREELGLALPTLVRLARDAWLERARPRSEDPPPGHACLSPSRIREVVEDALRNLILPGFDHVGIATQGARRRLESGG